MALRSSADLPPCGHLSVGPDHILRETSPIDIWSVNCIHIGLVARLRTWLRIASSLRVVRIPTGS